MPYVNTDVTVASYICSFKGGLDVVRSPYVDHSSKRFLGLFASVIAFAFECAI